MRLKWYEFAASALAALFLQVLTVGFQPSQLGAWLVVLVYDLPYWFLSTAVSVWRPWHPQLGLGWYVVISEAFFTILIWQAVRVTRILRERNSAQGDLHSSSSARVIGRVKWYEVALAAVAALILQWIVPFLFAVFGESVAALVFVLIASLPYSFIRSVWLFKLTLERPQSGWGYLLNECFYTAILVVVIRASGFFTPKPIQPGPELPNPR